MANYLIIDYNLDSDTIDFAHQLKDYNNFKVVSLEIIPETNLVTVELEGVTGFFNCPSNWVQTVEETIEELLKEFVNFTANSENYKAKELVLKSKILLGDFYES